MSDTRAAIRELRSLSEKRSTQGLNAEERVRLDELRQRLGLPPEPELGGAVPASAPQVSQEASTPATRRPSLAERIDAAVEVQDTGAASGPKHPAGMNGTAPPLAASAALPLPAPQTARIPEVATSLPFEPAAADEASGAPEPGDGLGASETAEASEPPEAPELAPRPLTLLSAVTALPSFASSEPPQPPESQPASETLATPDAPEALPPLEPPPASETFATFDAAEALPPLEPPPASETFATFDAQDALPPLEPPPASETFATFDAGEALPEEATLGASPPEGGIETAVAETSGPSFLESLEPSNAAELPPDGPVPGDPGAEGFGAEPLPPDTAPVPELPAEDGYGAEPLTPAPEPALVPPQRLPESGELVLAPEDLGATPLDVLPEAELPAQPLGESGPIELSAADVMLLEEDPRRDVSHLELGGDAAEPVPLAEAHDFVQYQRQDEGAIPLEPVQDEEGLGDPALLQASEAELATQAAPFVRPPAAPSLRVPPPPPSSAPLPRAVTVPSMPAPRPPGAIPAASVPAARAPAPPPATAAPVPRPAPSAPLPPPPAAATAPARAHATPAAAAARPEPAATAPAARPAFPTLTRQAPVSTTSQTSQPGRSGPFARPPSSLMPAAALDTMEDEPLAPPPEQQPVFGGPYLSPTFIEGEHRVVLHTLEGQVRRGTVSDVDLLDPVIRLSPPGALPDAIPAERIKAIFFMQSPGDSPLPQHGQRIRVSFSDGRQIVGFSEDVEVGENGFFLIPADLRTHTARIYVFRAGVHSITRA